MRAQRASVAEFGLEEEVKVERGLEQPRLRRILLERKLIGALLRIVDEIIGDRDPIALAQEVQEIFVFRLPLGIEFGTGSDRSRHRNVAIAMFLDLQECDLALIFALAKRFDLIHCMREQQDVFQIPGIILPPYSTMRGKLRLDAFQPRLKVAGSGLRTACRRDQFGLQSRRFFGPKPRLVVL